MCFLRLGGRITSDSNGTTSLVAYWGMSRPTFHGKECIQVSYTVDLLWLTSASFGLDTCNNRKVKVIPSPYCRKYPTPLTGIRYPCTVGWTRWKTSLGYRTHWCVHGVALTSRLLTPHSPLPTIRSTYTNKVTLIHHHYNSAKALLQNYYKLTSERSTHNRYTQML